MREDVRPLAERPDLLLAEIEINLPCLSLGGCREDLDPWLTERLAEGLDLDEAAVLEAERLEAVSGLALVART